MNQQAPQTTPRITSIDALRGADMLLLAGGGALLQTLAPWCGGDLLRHQLTHAGWAEALTCWDLVMPLFIFLVGASMPFAFAKYRQQSLGRTCWRVARRCALLFVLGMLVQGRLATAVPERMSLFCNTLQAIAEGYLIAAVCLMFGGVRTQLVVCVACLASYWAALRFVPYDGHPAGLFLPHDNLAIWVDHYLQGPWQDGTPYSWILTSLSFGALTLMGSLAGELIRRRRPGSWRTLFGLIGAAGGCMLAGYMLSWDTPIIKHIYTSSMVLWSGGCCFALLAIFHLLFDYSSTAAKCAYPLRVVGGNAILAYILTQTPGLHGLSLWQSICYPLFGGLAAHGGAAAGMLLELLSLALLWAMLCFLYRHKALLRV